MGNRPEYRGFYFACARSVRSPCRQLPAEPREAAQILARSGCQVGIDTMSRRARWSDAADTGRATLIWHGDSPRRCRSGIPGGAPRPLLARPRTPAGTRAARTTRLRSLHDRYPPPPQRARWSRTEPRDERQATTSRRRCQPARHVNSVANARSSHGARFFGRDVHAARLHAGDPAAVHAGGPAADIAKSRPSPVDPDHDQRDPERTGPAAWCPRCA